MIDGLSVAVFTSLHVAISLIALVVGVTVVVDMLNDRFRQSLAAVFLGATLLTSVTGFMFPITALTPALIFGAVSLVVLAIAILALYGRRLAGAWRWLYIVSALVALYLNVFVAVFQAFQKLAFLSPLAPTQSEPPFLIAQAIVLVLFVILGRLALRRFHPGLQTWPVRQGGRAGPAPHHSR